MQSRSGRRGVDCEVERKGEESSEEDEERRLGWEREVGDRKIM